MKIITFMMLKKKFLIIKTVYVEDKREIIMVFKEILNLKNLIILFLLNTNLGDYLII